MSFSVRFLAATKAAAVHFLGSLLVAALAAGLVFWVWYPHPYGLLSGGLTLFLILISVDVVCGPLLTLVLFNPKKPCRELIIDMGLVVVIQMGALAYGVHTVFQARPLYLVHEIDRFRVITVGDYGEADVSGAIAQLDAPLRPHTFKGPVTVGIRDPRNREESQDVLWESVFGGRDFSQRPDFYIPYNAAYLPKALARTKPLKAFLEEYPETGAKAADLLKRANLPLEQAKFLPVLHKQEWVAVMDAQARIIGFLPGDGFAVP